MRRKAGDHAPKYNQVTWKDITDGFVTKRVWVIDNTVPPTEDDIRWIENQGVGTELWLRELDEFLLSLEPIENDLIRGNADRLRQIVGGLGHLRTHFNYTNEEYLKFGAAWELRSKIVALRNAANIRKGASTGGNTRAQQLKDEAVEWQAAIKTEAVRMIRRGMSLRSIGTRLAPDTAINGRPAVTAGQVRDYASLLRNALPKK